MTLEEKIMVALSGSAELYVNQIAYQTTSNRSDVIKALSALVADGKAVRLPYDAYRITPPTPTRKPRGERSYRVGRVQDCGTKLKTLTRVCNLVAPEVRAVLEGIKEDIKRLDRYGRGITK